MALDLVDKRDLSVVQTLTSEEQNAIRAVAAGSVSGRRKYIVLKVIGRTHDAGLWLGCDCRSENGRRPVVAPCRNRRGTDFWRLLIKRQVEHSKDCVFARTRAQRRLAAVRWNPSRAAKKAPGGWFAVLRDSAEDERVSKPDGRSAKDSVERKSAHWPALSQLQLMLMEKAGLNRIRPGEESKDPKSWEDALFEQAKEIEIAPGRLLCDLWFRDVELWISESVQDQVEAAARDWPAGHKPQGFLSWVVWRVDARGVDKPGRNTRVEIASSVRWPAVGRSAIRRRRPYLFLGAVGLADERRGYECLEGYAQPIVASDCPVPVDSHYERQAFGTLKMTLRVLSHTFREAAFELEKPVFEIETPEGPCLPDFLIRARRGGDEAVFVIEVMGFERTEYLQGKEVTHPRMATLGPLCLIQAKEFGRSPGGVKAEGTKVTKAIVRALRERWRG